MNKLFTVVFFLALYSFPLLAATYFVDSNQGNDGNSGLSHKHAFKTLDKVNALVLAPGDSVLFRSSTKYIGQLKISCRGSEQNRIIFSAYGAGNLPIIEGQGNFKETVLIFNSEYLTISNLEITNQGVERRPGRMGLHILLENFGIAHQIHISNLFVHDVNGVNVKKDGGGAGIHWSNGGRSIKSCFDGLIIENCKLQRTDRNGITGGGYWTRKEWFPSKNVIIRNNILEDIGGDGIVPIGCDGALVEYNKVYRAGQRFPEGDASAGIWPWSCDNTLVQYNEVAYTSGPWDAQGFDSDWNCNNSIFQYNYSHDNEGGFFLVCSPTEGNEMGNNGTIIRYNISQNDGHRIKWKAKGFSPVFHITGPVKNTWIYNNVVYLDRKRAPQEDKSIITFDTWGGAWPDSTYFTNNVFYTSDTVKYKWGKSANSFFSSNCYYGQHVNLPEDQSAIYSDPLFIRGGSGKDGLNTLDGYRLESSSPCIGKGKIIRDDILMDFFFNKIPLKQGKYNIGVYQTVKPLN